MPTLGQALCGPFIYRLIRLQQSCKLFKNYKKIDGQLVQQCRCCLGGLHPIYEHLGLSPSSDFDLSFRPIHTWKVMGWLKYLAYRPPGRPGLSSELLASACLAQAYTGIWRVNQQADYLYLSTFQMNKNR